MPRPLAADPYSDRPARPYRETSVPRHVDTPHPSERGRQFRSARCTENSTRSGMAGDRHSASAAHSVSDHNLPVDCHSAMPSGCRAQRAWGRSVPQSRAELELSYARGTGDGHGHFDALPVDFTARAITALGDDAREGYRTYNVVNPHENGISLDTVVDWLMAAGHPLTRVQATPSGPTASRPPCAACPTAGSSIRCSRCCTPSPSRHSHSPDPPCRRTGSARRSGPQPSTTTTTSPVCHRT